MASATVLASLEEYAARTAAGERLEYSDGVIEAMPNNDSVHDIIKGALAMALTRQLPEPFFIVSEMTFAVTPVHVRHPDVAVLKRSPPMVEGQRVPGAPDLAIEIVSDSDTAQSLDNRVELYLEHGAKAVWVVWPRAHRIDIHQSGKAIRQIRSGILTGEVPVPELRLDIDRLFTGT